MSRPCKIKSLSICTSILLRLIFISLPFSPPMAGIPGFDTRGLRRPPQQASWVVPGPAVVKIPVIAAAWILGRTQSAAQRSTLGHLLGPARFRGLTPRQRGLQEVSLVPAVTNLVMSLIYGTVTPPTITTLKARLATVLQRHLLPATKMSILTS